MLSGKPPPGFVIDHTRGRLGGGENTFQEAKDAIQNWQHFQLGWVEPCDASTPIEEGQVVGILARCFGVWFLNARRIVTVVDSTESMIRFGFSYGTLADHAESGEERFQVEWNLSDNSVWYDILAYSRPQKWYTKIGSPIVRRIQKRFAQDSLAAMQKCANGSA